MMLLRLLVIGYLAAVGSCTVNWLAMAAVSDIGRNASIPISVLCKSLPGLTRKQIKFCRRNFETINSIRQGARDAYSECQYQFHLRRWNCTMIDPVSREVFADVILKDGTREAAFVHAVSAAGVAYRITKDCSQGLLEKCGCDLTKLETSQGSSSNGRQIYAHKGCSDNVHYGIAISKEFLEAAEKSKNHTQERRLMNEHNNRAGREVLISSLRRQCKCHGISGSCETQTCWDAVPSFREIGNTIKEKFDGATEVKVIREARRPRIERKNQMLKRHTPTDLVYLHESPDFCEPSSDRGILGTHGRQCNISTLAIDGCDLLCCNRGFETTTKIVKERCNCKFHYCCRVECDTCEKEVSTYTCK
uniref:Protein Wnt n=1 Tax=Panagrellus redivivus TaxID=6233 RepID=A0A7E4ZTK7_PANRE